jgi:hypothetical protein
MNTSRPPSAELRLAASVLEAPSVLDLVGRYARQGGYAGVDASTARLPQARQPPARRPISLAITGPSSGGRTTSRVVFPLFPDTAYRELSGMSRWPSSTASPRPPRRRREQASAATLTGWGRPATRSGLG